MKPFQTIAIPHQDILADRVRMDAFTADLWDVHKGRASQGYADDAEFFRQTYVTDSLKRMIERVKQRLFGQCGEPVLNIQTPSGNGKTHALIALYHQAARWNAKRVVIVGTAMSATDTFWGMLEQQLTGQCVEFTRPTSPGREALHRLLSRQGPCVILIDELLQYISKAATVRLGESTTAAQTLGFLQELAEVINVLSEQAMVITLPSGVFERYDQQSEWFFVQFQKVMGGMEKAYTPIQPHDVPSILRTRLFSEIDATALQEALDQFMAYALRESLIPPGIESNAYRRQFEATYPFLPEMLDTLAQRWGSFAGFQGIRGMLRLLMLLLGACKDLALPYLTLADFNLSNHDIRRELLRYVGGTFDEVILSDLMGENATVRAVEQSLEYDGMPFPFAMRAATTIFLSSFSESGQTGASFAEIKRHALLPDQPARMISEVMRGFQERLNFLHAQQNKYLFLRQPNLNYLLMMSTEHIQEYGVDELEQELLRKALPGKHFEVIRLMRGHRDVPDTPALKLVVLKEQNDALMKQIITFNGKLPRVNQNTIFFLLTAEHETPELAHLLKQYLGWGMLLTESEQTVSDEQKRMVKMRWKTMEAELDDAIRKKYRRVVIPTKQGLSVRDIGLRRTDRHANLEEELYALLLASGDIIEYFPATQIKEQYLRNKPFVFTEQLYRISTTTLGEPRLIDRSVCENAIKEGVLEGLFGLGVLKGKELICTAFKQKVFYMNFSDDEVIIRDELSGMLLPVEERAALAPMSVVETRRMPENDEAGAFRREAHLRFPVPQKNVSALMGMIQSLRQRFQTLTIELHAEDGEMSEQEYAMQIQDVLRHLQDGTR